MKFRGKNVVEVNKHGYPAVYWPEHELANTAGLVYVHHVVALEKFGELPEGHVVHHRDGDPWNRSPENLELMTHEEHGKHHHGIPRIEVKCKGCGTSFKKLPASNQRYCSRPCVVRVRTTDWPTNFVMKWLVWQMPCEDIGEMLGVTGRAVSKHCKREGIETPGRGYWQKRFAGA